MRFVSGCVKGDDKMYREVFQSRVKKAREETGFTQREVAKETGIPLSTIAKYETGKLEPDLEKLGIFHRKIIKIVTRHTSPLGGRSSPPRKTKLSIA